LTLTRQVKQELARLDDEPACCSSWELKALLLRHGYYTLLRREYNLSVAVDHIYVARRLFYLLRKAGVLLPNIYRQQEKRLGKSQFVVQVQGSEQVDALLMYLDLKEMGCVLTLSRRHTAVPKRSCCRKAFLRGAFLAGGSISVSKRSGYHLEINCGGFEDAQLYQAILNSFNLLPLLRVRKDTFFLYFKNAEAVADFLRIVGAGNTLLQIESQRVFKSMRNQVNRLVNCETANLEKVVATARQQLDLINEIDNLIGLNNLSPALRDVAQARLKHPEASLKELGELLAPPVTKSGVNHRFRTLGKILKKNR
jgi:cell division protein WhiA